MIRDLWPIPASAVAATVICVVGSWLFPNFGRQEPTAAAETLAAPSKTNSGIFQGLKVLDLVHKGVRVPGALLEVELGAITRCRLVIIDRSGNTSTAYDPDVRASSFIFPGGEPLKTSWQVRTDLPPWIESVTIEVEVGGVWQVFKKSRPAQPVKHLKR